MRKDFSSPRAQSALEYLLIIGGGVLIATIVLLIIIQSTSTQNGIFGNALDGANVNLHETAFGDTFGPKITNFEAFSTPTGIQVSWQLYEGNKPVTLILSREVNSNLKLVQMTDVGNYYTFAGAGVDYIFSAPPPSFPRFFFLDDAPSFNDNLFMVKGDVYYYKLLACDSVSPANCSISLAIPSATYSGDPSDVFAPSSPILFQAVSENAHVDLSWSAPPEPDVSSYRLYRGFVENGIPKPTSFLQNIPFTSPAFSDTSVVNGITYYYELSAVDMSGNESVKANVQSTPAAAEFGPEEIVFDAQIDLGAPDVPGSAPDNGCGFLDVPDTSAHAIRDDTGMIQLFATFHNSRRTTGYNFDLYNAGTNPNGLRRNCTPTSFPPNFPYPATGWTMDGVVHPSGFDPNFLNYNDEEWLATPYYLGDNNVYMLVHNEFHPEKFSTNPLYPEYSSCSSSLNCQPYTTMTSAFSTNKGLTYEQSDPVALVAAMPGFTTFNPTSEATGYGGHSNIVPYNGHYYSMLHIIQEPFNPGAGQGLCIVRTPAPLQEDSVWMGYSGSIAGVPQFNADLRGVDPCTRLGPNASTMHSSLTYNTKFGKFMLVGTHGQWVNIGNGPQLMTGVYYSLSTNLVDWESPVLIAFAKMPWTGIPPGVELPLSSGMAVYPSIIDHDSPDPNFVWTDDEAYIYYSKQPTAGVVASILARRKITFK